MALTDFFLNFKTIYVKERNEYFHINSPSRFGRVDIRPHDITE